MPEFRSMGYDRTLTIQRAAAARSVMVCIDRDGGTALAFNTTDPLPIAAAILDAAGMTVEEFVAHAKPDAVVVDGLPEVVRESARVVKIDGNHWDVDSLDDRECASQMRQAINHLAYARYLNAQAKANEPDPQDVEALAAVVKSASAAHYDGQPETVARAILRSGEWQRVAK